MADGLTAQAALTQLLTQVLPPDSNTFSSFFEYNGIDDIDDFMSFSDVDFDKSYSTIGNELASIT